MGTHHVRIQHAHFFFYTQVTILASHLAGRCCWASDAASPRATDTLGEFLSAMDGARTRVEEGLVAQELHVREVALAQEPHVLRVDCPDGVDGLSDVLAGRDALWRSLWFGRRSHAARCIFVY